MNKAKISEQEIMRLNDEFLGKKVELVDGRGMRHVGVAQFIGINPFIPEWELQVTLNRTPCSHVDPGSIRLYAGR